jgi:hypothetical protein
VRTLNPIETAVFSKLGYNALARVRIADADDVLRDYANLPVGKGLNWVNSVEWAESNDQPTMVATVRLARAHWNLSVAPLNDSALNRKANGTFGRLLDIGRRIFIDAAVSGSDAGPGFWVPVFEGRILEVDWGKADDNEVVVTARDRGGRILDRFIEVDKLPYSSGGGTAVQTVMQDILNANMVGEIPTMVTIGAPGWSIRRFQQERMGTLEAIRRLAAQIGWDVRFRWTGVAFELAFYEPPRVVAVTPDRVWTRDFYYSVSQQRYSLEDIRNRVVVAFTQRIISHLRQTVLVQDAGSQTAYGIRFMEISEAATSGIDTSAEATRMANAILTDLKEPRSFVTLVTPLFYPAQLGDTIEIEKDGVTFDQAIKIVVYSVRHSIADGVHRTEWTGRQTGGGYRDRWMESEVRPGVGPRQDVTLDSNSLRAIRDGGQVIAQSTVTTIIFDLEQYDVGANYNPGTGVYTVPATGIYELNSALKFFTDQANVTMQMHVFVNGALLASGDRLSQPAASVDTYLKLKTVTLTVIAGDAVDVRFVHDSAGATRFVAGGLDSYLTIRRLRGE